MVAIYGKETLVCSRNALCREPRHTQNVKRTSDQLLVRYNFRPTRSHCNALQSVLAQTSAPHKLLDWLQQQDPVAETQALMVDVTASISGRCLRVKSDTPPDAPLLSVPLSIVFEDQERDEDTNIPWSGRMALCLLQQKQLCTSSEEDQDGALCPWIAALPTQVTLPHIHFSQDEIEAVQDMDTMREALAMKESHEACFEELEQELANIGCSRLDFDWAVSVLHSRCFVMGPAAVHTSLPGVDMANHSHTPSATLRLHLPGPCQGSAALEEVCEKPSQGWPTQPPCFQLLAGPDGLRAGEEVTISYGNWPNDVFLLFFGFIQEPNEHDAVVLFQDLPDLVSCFSRMQQQQPIAEPHTTLQQQRHSLVAVGQQQQQALEQAAAENQVRQVAQASQPAQQAGLAQQQQHLQEHALQPAQPEPQQGLEQVQGLGPEGALEQATGGKAAAADGQQGLAMNATEQGPTEQLLAGLIEKLGPEDWSEYCPEDLSEDWSRMVITASGLDGRLLPVVRKLLNLVQGKEDRAPVRNTTPGDFISWRCNELLQGYCTTMQQDMQILTDGSLNGNMQLATRYRLAKKAMLAQACEAASHIQ